MQKEIQNMQNIHSNNQINSNRTRINMQNFQFEINSLIKQLELLECENSQLKDRLFQKNEDLLIQITNFLPKEYTDNFINGLKKQSLHINMVGDVAMSYSLNNQYESTYSKQIQADIMNLRSIIIIQKDKQKISESKIVELNDFIRQQDNLLTQSKILLKEKCAKIQALEQQLKEINMQLNNQQPQKSKNNHLLQDRLQTEEDNFYLGSQNQQQQRNNHREQQIENFSSISANELKENLKENHKPSSLQRMSIESMSSNTLQVNRNIVNKNNSIIQDLSQRQLTQNSNKMIEKKDIPKQNKKQIYEPENKIKYSKINNSPSLQGYENKQSDLFNNEQFNNRVIFEKPSCSDYNNNKKRETILQQNKGNFEIREILGQFYQEKVEKKVGLQNEEYFQKSDNQFVQHNMEQRQFNNKSSFEKNDEQNQNNLSIQSRRGRQERSNSNVQLNQQNKNQSPNQFEEKCPKKNYSVKSNNNVDGLECSPLKMKSKKEVFQLNLQNIKFNQQSFDKEYLNKSNRSLYNNYSSSQTGENDENENKYQGQQKSNLIPNNLKYQQQIQQVKHNQQSSNNNKTISNVIYNFQKENSIKNINDDLKVNCILNSSFNDENDSTILSIVNQSNVFEMSNRTSNNNTKPFNQSNQRTYNQMSCQYQQQVYQPPVQRIQDNQIMSTNLLTEQNYQSQETYPDNVHSALDTQKVLSSILNPNKYNQQNQKTLQLNQDDIKSQRIHSYQQVYTENNELIKDENNIMQEIFIPSNNRNKSDSKYFNVYDQKAINANKLNQIQQHRKSLNTRTEYSNQKSNDQLDSDMRNNGVSDRSIQSFYNNQVFKTENSPYKRSDSQSNGRRRSRAERIQKSSSSIRIYNSNDYNTFNPLN